MKDQHTKEIHEAIENYGTNAVTTEDLIAVLLENKTKAEKIMSTNDEFKNTQLDGLGGILRQDHDGLLYMGLTSKEATKLLAAIELGKRSAKIEYKTPEKINNPGTAANYIQTYLENENHEKVLVILLNSKNKVMKVKQISEGSVGSSVVHPREILAPAINAHATSIIIVHNHPSGETEPSSYDNELTKKMTEACEIMGIPLLDHIIIGKKRDYYSYKEHGKIQEYKKE